jgi:hypothetical protein
MAEDTKGGEETIAGTPFKTVEELAKGYTELNSLVGKKGEEAGSYKKQVETLTEALKAASTQRPAPAQKEEKAPMDYGVERKTVQKAIMELDPMGDGYQSKLADLMDRLTNLTATEQHEKTLNAATSVFKKELDERDTTAAQQKFKDQYSDFDAPETQIEIRRIMAADRTGMHDPLSAYFQLLRDREASEKTGLATENAELKKRLELAEGAQRTGKVMAGAGQSPGPAPSKPPKATGKDLDAGMADVLRNLNA